MIEKITCSETGRTFLNISHAHRVNAEECKNPCSFIYFYKRIMRGETNLKRAIEKKRVGEIITCPETGRVFDSVSNAYWVNAKECKKPCSYKVFWRKIRNGRTDLMEAIKKK
jgi:hypothetical protein